MRTDETLKARAREMRANPTPAEQKLWLLLKGKRFVGTKFTRQAIIGSYIADFAAPSANLIIEIDGDTHGAQVEYDAARTSFIERQGYRVIRFTNSDVMGNVEGVLAAIAAALAVPSPPPPQPASGRSCPQHDLNSAGRCSPDTPRGGRGKWV